MPDAVYMLATFSINGNRVVATIRRADFPADNGFSLSIGHLIFPAPSASCLSAVRCNFGARLAQPARFQHFDLNAGRFTTPMSFSAAVRGWRHRARLFFIANPHLKALTGS